MLQHVRPSILPVNEGKSQLTGYVAKAEPGKSIIVAVGVLLTIVVLLRLVGIWF